MISDIIEIDDNGETKTGVFSPSSSPNTYHMGRMILDNAVFPHLTPIGPYFDLSHSENVTAVTKGRAVLNCRVYNLGNRTVRDNI